MLHYGNKINKCMRIWTLDLLNVTQMQVWMKYLVFLWFGYECKELPCVAAISLKHQLILQIWIWSFRCLLFQIWLWRLNFWLCYRCESELWGVVFYIWLKMGCYYDVVMSLNYRLCAYFRHESEVLAVLVFQLWVWGLPCVWGLNLKDSILLFYR